MASWAETAAAAALDGGADYSKAASETLSDASDTLQKYIDNTNTTFRNGMTDLNSLFTNINDGMTNWAKADELSAQRQGIANQFARNEALEDAKQQKAKTDNLDEQLKNANKNVNDQLNGNGGERFNLAFQQSLANQKKAQEKLINDLSPTTPNELMKSIGINTVQDSIYKDMLVTKIITPANNEVASANSIIDTHSIGQLSKGSYRILSSENAGKIDQNTGKSLNVLLANEKAELGLGDNDSPLKTMPQDQIVKYATNMKEAQIAKDNGWITLGQYLALGKLSSNKEFIDAANKVVEIEAKKMDQLKGYIYDEETAYDIADIALKNDTNGIFKGMTRSQLANTLYNDSLVQKQARMQSQFAIASNQEGMDVIKRPVAQGNGAPTNNNNQQGGQQQGTDSTNPNGSNPNNTNADSNNGPIYGQKVPKSSTSSSLNSINTNNIFSVAAKYESNFDGSRIGNIPNDPGNKSYGSLQINTHTMKAYLDESSKFGHKFNGLKIGSEAFDTKWKEIANSDEGDAFIQDQIDFLTRTHYNPAVKKLADYGLNVSDRSPALQQTIASLSISRGGENAAKFIKKALDAKKIDPKTADERTIIEAIYDYEHDTIADYYTSVDEDVRNSRRARSKKEKADVLDFYDTISPYYSSQISNANTIKEQNKNELTKDKTAAGHQYVSGHATNAFFNGVTEESVKKESMSGGSTAVSQAGTIDVDFRGGSMVDEDVNMYDHTSLHNHRFLSKVFAADEAYLKESSTLTHIELFDNLMKSPINDIKDAYKIVQSRLTEVSDDLNKYISDDLNKHNGSYEYTVNKMNEEIAYLSNLSDRINMVKEAKESASKAFDINNPYGKDNTDEIVKQYTDKNEFESSTRAKINNASGNEFTTLTSPTGNSYTIRTEQLEKTSKTNKQQQNNYAANARAFIAGINYSNEDQAIYDTYDEVNDGLLYNFTGVQLRDHTTNKPANLKSDDNVGNNIMLIACNVMGKYIEPSQLKQFMDLFKKDTSIRAIETALSTEKGEKRLQTIQNVTDAILNIIAKENESGTATLTVRGRTKAISAELSDANGTIATELKNVMFALSNQNDGKLSFKDPEEIKKEAGIKDEDPPAIVAVKFGALLNSAKNPYNK